MADHSYATGILEIKSAIQLEIRSVIRRPQKASPKDPPTQLPCISTKSQLDLCAIMDPVRPVSISRMKGLYGPPQGRAPGEWRRGTNSCAHSALPDPTRGPGSAEESQAPVSYRSPTDAHPASPDQGPGRTGRTGGLGAGRPAARRAGHRRARSQVLQTD